MNSRFTNSFVVVLYCRLPPGIQNAHDHTNVMTKNLVYVMKVEATGKMGNYCLEQASIAKKHCNESGDNELQSISSIS